MLRLDPIALNTRDHIHEQSEGRTDCVLVTLHLVSTYDTVCYSVFVNIASTFSFLSICNYTYEDFMCTYIYI